MPPPPSPPSPPLPPVAPSHIDGGDPLNLPPPPPLPVMDPKGISQFEDPISVKPAVQAGALNSGGGAPASTPAKAIVEHAFLARFEDELPLQGGETVTVLSMPFGGWWEGVLGERRGWFPANHVRLQNDLGAVSASIITDAPLSSSVSTAEYLNVGPNTSLEPPLPSVTEQGQSSNVHEPSPPPFSGPSAADALGLLPPRPPSSTRLSVTSAASSLDSTALEPPPAYSDASQHALVSSSPIIGRADSAAHNRLAPPRPPQPPRGVDSGCRSSSLDSAPILPPSIMEVRALGAAGAHRASDPVVPIVHGGIGDVIARPFSLPPALGIERSPLERQMCIYPLHHHTRQRGKENQAER